MAGKGGTRVVDAMRDWGVSQWSPAEMAGKMVTSLTIRSQSRGLNGVRPRWPEQFALIDRLSGIMDPVSMESGLDGRNNHFRTERLSKPSPWSQWSPA